MINLSNRENLSVSCFEKSLQELSDFCKDEERVALDMVENPKQTVHRLRRILDSTQSALRGLKSEVLVSIPATTEFTDRQRRHRAGSIALRNLLLTSASPSEKQQQQQQQPVLQNDIDDGNAKNNVQEITPRQQQKQNNNNHHSYSSNDATPTQEDLLAQLSFKYQELQKMNRQKHMATKPGELKGFTSVRSPHQQNFHNSQLHHVSFLQETVVTNKKKNVTVKGYNNSVTSFFDNSAIAPMEDNKKKGRNHRKRNKNNNKEWNGDDDCSDTSSSSSSFSSDGDNSSSESTSDASHSSLTSLQRRQRQTDKIMEKRKRQDARREAAEARKRKVYNDQDSDEEYAFDPATLTYQPKDPAFIRKKIAMYNNNQQLTNRKKMKEYKRLLEQHHNSKKIGVEESNDAMMIPTPGHTTTNNVDGNTTTPNNNNINATSTTFASRKPIHPTQYLSIGTHFFLELLARQTLAKEVILYRHTPGDATASVVTVFCTRPQLELYGDVLMAESLVGRVISSGVAVNISPECPTETNFPRLVVPIFSTGRRTVVVGAVVLQHRACGGSFASSEEMCAAAWCELAAHLVQPPAILKGKPRPMTNNKSTRIPTSMLPAIDFFLPKKGRIVANMNRCSSTVENGANNNNNNNSAATGAEMYQIQNRHIDESLVFDPFSTNQSNYRNELWSTTSLLDAIELNYKSKFEEVRRERILNSMAAAGAQISASNNNKLQLTKSLGSVDRFVNSSFLSSLHDMTISSSQRIEGETGAHKFLMQLCSKLSESIDEENNNSSKKRNNKDNNNDSTSPSTSSRRSGMTREQEKGLAEIGGAGGAGKALLQLIASSQKQSNNVASAEALLQSAISEKTKKKNNTSSNNNINNNNKNVLLKSIMKLDYDSNLNNTNSNNATKDNQSRGDDNRNSSTPHLHQPNQSMLFSPDDLADLVDRCEVPLLVLRSVFQDVWKVQKSSSSSSSGSAAVTDNNNMNDDSSSREQQQQRLSWYPAQRSAAAIISSAAKGSGKNTTAHNHSSKNDASESATTGASSMQNNNKNNTNQHSTGGTMSLPKTSGISESINACISTLPVVDVATHVARLEYSWRNAIDDQRATDLHHLTHLADYSKTKHKLTVVERQRNEALTTSDEASKKYAKLKNQIGMLCSREFMAGVGATNSMANALPKIVASPPAPPPPNEGSNQNGSPRRQSHHNNNNNMNKF